MEYSPRPTSRPAASAAAVAAPLVRRRRLLELLLLEELVGVLARLGGALGDEELVLEVLQQQVSLQLGTTGRA